jgi:hypothetical protein
LTIFGIFENMWYWIPVVLIMIPSEFNHVSDIKSILHKIS